jgi:hypothetical protein
MSLFLNQLKTLLETLSNVKDPESFDIAEWHVTDGGLNCGFAACVCGHQAIAPPSPHFRVMLEPPSEFNLVAKSIGRQLEDACEKLTGEEHLAVAIIAGDMYSRVNNAEESGVFTEVELLHPHLIKEDPTIEEAISFIQLVIRKVVAL